MGFDREGFYHDVGARLQLARKRKGMTQEAVAAELGMPRGSYANLESGRQRITLDVLWRVAIVLEVPLTSLVPEPIYFNAHDVASVTAGATGSMAADISELLRYKPTS